MRCLIELIDNHALIKDMDIKNYDLVLIIFLNLIICLFKKKLKLNFKRNKKLAVLGSMMSVSWFEIEFQIKCWSYFYETCSPYYV